MRGAPAPTVTVYVSFFFISITVYIIENVIGGRL